MFPYNSGLVDALKSIGAAARLLKQLGRAAGVAQESLVGAPDLAWAEPDLAPEPLRFPWDEGSGTAAQEGGAAAGARGGMKAGGGAVQAPGGVAAPRAPLSGFEQAPAPPAPGLIPAAPAPAPAKAPEPGAGVTGTTARSPWPRTDLATTTSIPGPVAPGSMEPQFWPRTPNPGAPGLPVSPRLTPGGAQAPAPRPEGPVGLALLPRVLERLEAGAGAAANRPGPAAPDGDAVARAPKPHAPAPGAALTPMPHAPTLASPPVAASSEPDLARALLAGGPLPAGWRPLFQSPDPAPTHGPSLTQLPGAETQPLTPTTAPDREPNDDDLARRLKQILLAEARRHGIDL